MMCVTADVDMECWLNRVVLLLDFCRLIEGQLPFLGCQRFFIAWPLVHCHPVWGTQLLPHPLGALHAASGGERAWAGCAPRGREVLQPSVVMRLADAWAHLATHSSLLTATCHQLLLLLAHCSPLAVTAAVATHAPPLRTQRRLGESHSRERHTQTAHTHSEQVFHACLAISKPWLRTASNSASSARRVVVLLTRREGGILIGCLCMRAFHLSLGPFLLHTLH